MKDFHFQQFTVQQDAAVFRVGTDAVLLGALADVAGANRALEVGTGTGIISLMLAQRNPALTILALDLDEMAVTLAAANFQQSAFAKRLKAQFADFRTFETGKKFDLIFSNPPYFEANPSEKDVRARQKTDLDFADLISKSAEMLSPTGRLTVILPVFEQEEFEKKSQKVGLCARRRIYICGRRGMPAKRCILEFRFEELPSTDEIFTVEESPRKYSAEYLQMTKDFHVFTSARE